jgi:hypothetical protein
MPLAPKVYERYVSNMIGKLAFLFKGIYVRNAHKVSINILMTNDRFGGFVDYQDEGSSTSN